MELIKIIINSGAFEAAIGAIVALIVDSIRNRKKKKKEDDECDMLLLLDAIERRGRNHIADGYITIEDLAKLRAFHQAYKKKGGDGWADALMEQAEKLPKSREVI